MNIGQVYIVDGKAVMPISVPDLEGYFLQIEIPLDKSSMGQYPNHPIFEGAASFMGGKTLNVRRANEYMEITNNGIKNLSAVIANTKNKKTYVSTYVPISTTPLSIGDDFVELANNTAYTVFGYFPKEVAVGAKIGNQNTIKLYPYGINVQPMMEYIDSVTRGKLGLSEICKDKDTKKGLADTSKKSIEDLAIQNSRLPFAAANYQKPNSLLYVKQDRPAKVVQPIKMVQKKAKGQKLVTTQSVTNTLSNFKKALDGFETTTNLLGYTFNDSQKVERFKQWQENNFIAPQPPAFSLTGNKLLDDFTFVTVEYMPEQDNLFGVLISPYGLMPKNQPNVKKYNLDKIGNHSAYIDTSGSNEHYESVWRYVISGYELLDECVKTEDYSRYVKVSNFGKDFNSLKYLTGVKSIYNNVDNHGIIKYFGGGLFSCLQNNEQPVSGDMYGVGDMFTLTKNGSLREMVVLYMYFALDKKQNKKKICVCMAYDNLAQMEMETGKNSEPLFHIEADWLEANATNHKSYFEARKKIKDFYLYEGATTASAGTTPVSPYQEYKDLLGEEYDDEFLSAVSQLDWMRINEVQKVKPEIMDALKVIVSELYLAYLKDKANRPITQEASNEEINFGKYYYDLFIDNPTKEAMISVLTNMAQLLGDDVLNYFTYIKGEETSVAANVDLDDVKNYMNAGIGSQEDLRKISTRGGWHRNKQSIVFQEKQEPVLQVIIKSRLDIDDSELYVTVSNLINETKQFSGRSSKEVNYYQMYVGDAIMRYLIIVDFLQKSDAIPDSKKKKIFPFVLTDYAIQKLQYMNRWGLFDTPEMMYERLVKQQSVKLFNSRFADLNYLGNLMSIYVSYSTSIAYDSNEKNQEFIKSVKKDYSDLENYIINNKDAVISYLYSLPIDWGNKDAPYMMTAATPTPVAPAKKRKSKTTTPEPTTPTTKIELDYDNPEGIYGDELVTEEVIKNAQMAQYNNTFAPKLQVRQFTYPLKNGGASELYNLRIDIPKKFQDANIVWDFLENKMLEFEEEGLFEFSATLDEKYEGFQEQQNYLEKSKSPDYYTMVLSSEGFDNFRKLNAAMIDYFENISKGTSTTTTTTPTTGEFQWIKEPWQEFTSEEANKKYREVYGTPKDKSLEFCSFTAGYPTPNYPPKTIYLLAMPYSDKDTFTALHQNLFDKYESKVEWRKLMSNYLQIGEAINKLVGDYIIVYFHEEDLVNVITDIVKAIGMPVSSATTTTTKPKFEWITGGWALEINGEDKDALNYKYDLGDDFNLLSTVVKIGEQIYHIYAFDNYYGTGKFHEIDRVLEGNPKTLTQDEKQKIYDEFVDGTDKLYEELTDFKTYWFKRQDDTFNIVLQPLIDKAREEYDLSQKTFTPAAPVKPTEPTVKTTKKTKEPKTTQTTKTPKTPKPKKGKLSPEELSQSLDDIDLDF